ncbi:MAG: RNA 2',3'-cyclic phosphodiesterase [Gammaproteobacteria bacterium]|nr:RNA 2',3'-cyclic phosphodiesterase [Gammaproteobacteria bacterium]MBL6998315.1 RNA 2',3'-cyclic phosphodiesterase [Gammaproteobacteria bacterium]
MRLFIAIELAADIQQVLLSYQPNTDRDLRRVQQSQLHLTLHFLGEADAQIIDQSLAGIRASRFELCLHSLGRFQDRRQQSTLWAGVQSNSHLLALQRTIGQQLQQTEIALESRRYTPHITLARCHRACNPALIQHFLAQTAPTHCFPVDEFALYRSDLDSDGAHYRIIQRYALV